MNGESNMETYTAICKADSPWEFAVGLRELKPGLCDHLEEWGGRWEGGSRGREHTEKKKKDRMSVLLNRGWSGGGLLNY